MVFVPLLFNPLNVEGTDTVEKIVSIPLLFINCKALLLRFHQVDVPMT